MKSVVTMMTAFALYARMAEPWSVIYYRNTSLVGTHVNTSNLWIRENSKLYYGEGGTHMRVSSSLIYAGVMKLAAMTDLKSVGEYP